MTQAIVDPEEVIRFAQNLKIFNGRLRQETSTSHF